MEGMMEEMRDEMVEENRRIRDMNGGKGQI